MARITSTLFLLLIGPAWAFTATSRTTRTFVLRASGGKGFGKPSEPTAPPKKQQAPESTTTIGSATPLQSLQDAEPTPVQVDENIPVEERTAALLKNKYGMKTLAEQQLEGKQLEEYKQQQKKLKELKRKAELGEDLDIMAMIPGPVQIAIDGFLKVGVTVCGILFVLAGLGIALEAYSKSVGDPLPENIDSFIVQTIEPNFTPGLFVLLGFSVSLGVFAALQLSSAGATYREDE